LSKNDTWKRLKQSLKWLGILVLIFIALLIIIYLPFGQSPEVATRMQTNGFLGFLVLLGLASPFLILISLIVPILKKSKKAFKIFNWAVLLGCLLAILCVLYLHAFFLEISRAGGFGF
jgi:hypothetical protein